MNARSTEPWRDRLNIPAYQVSEAARYAGTSAQTVGNWERLDSRDFGVISPRQRGIALSYLQLIELGVVASMRKAGVSLTRIRQARAYLCQELGSKHPFAEFRFKTDGKELFVSYDQITHGDYADKLLSVNKEGQLAWKDILAQRLREFEYETGFEHVLSWKVAGVKSPIRIDPRISFGAPQISGVPTWVVKDRWVSGESVFDIAEDYCLSKDDVISALVFEGVQVDSQRRNLWTN